MHPEVHFCNASHAHFIRDSPVIDKQHSGGKHQLSTDQDISPFKMLKR
jgi:hypothetical protein